MTITPKDKEILRKLAAKQAEIAALPVQQEKIDLWSKCNRLEKCRPPVYLDEMPWNEFAKEEGLGLACEDNFCRGMEADLRRTLYRWEHMPADMVVEGTFYSPLAIGDSGYGISEDTDIVTTDETSDVVSRHFKVVIKEAQDIEKILVPKVTHDERESARRYGVLNEAFGDLLKIEKRGAAGWWFAPWDELIRWWGIQEALTDLVLKPELIHRAMERLVDAHIGRLEQLIEMGLLSLNNCNVRVGSGALGWTDELPGEEAEPGAVEPKHLWGCATPQIFSEVSPQMHDEFALKHELRWLEKFGLNYYGCCEPLHHKIGILRKIPRLRKISVSPKAKADVAAAEIGNDYVLSLKPNPAILATDDWDADKVRAYTRELFEQTRGCVVEMIMKDISTVRYKPRRLHDWARIAVEEAERIAGG